jgi:hypothetical protein
VAHIWTSLSPPDLDIISPLHSGTISHDVIDLVTFAAQSRHNSNLCISHSILIVKS